ncbi:hypothetical protein ACSSS7_003242 [Eimeria intestinalis]
MATSTNGGIQAVFPSPIGALEIGTVPLIASRQSEFQGGLYGVTHGLLRSATKSGFFQCFFAVSVASLTIAYVLLSCFQSASFAPRVESGARSLATGGSGGGLCPGWPQGADSEEASGDEEAAEGGSPDTGSLAGAVGGAEVQGGEQGRPSSAFQLVESGWGLGRMPPYWLGRVTGFLVSIKRLATTYMTLLPLLNPSQALELCEQLVGLAVIELSAAAYIPETLQPLRSEAAAAFSSMIEKVQSTEATQNTAKVVLMEKKLRILKSVIGKVGSTPPRSTYPVTYRKKMVASLPGCTYSVTQTLAVLESLLPEQQRRGPDTQVVRKALNVLQAIYRTRKLQVLGDLTLRHWLVACQTATRSSIVYTRKEFVESPMRLKQEKMRLSERLDKAILEAGGTPVPSLVTLASPKPEPYGQSSAVPPASGSGLGPTQAHDVQLHRTRPSAREPLVPLSPFASGPSELAHHPSGPDQPTAPLQLQASDLDLQEGLSPGSNSRDLQSTAPSSQPSQQPPQGSLSLWEEPGARPRQPGAESAESQLEHLGWGYRRMPIDWSMRMVDLLNLMRGTAIECRSLLPWLSPEEAVSLSMRLSMLTAVNASVLAYLPFELQHLRQEMVTSYRQLLDFVSTRPTQSPASSKALASKLASMRVLLERLAGVPPDILLGTLQYMKRMIVHYKIMRYTYLQASSLLRELLLSQQSSMRGPVQPKAIITAIEKMFYALRMHLFGDEALRSWFVSQASKLSYPLYQNEDLEKAASRRRLKVKPLLRRLQTFVQLSGATPINLEAAALPPDSQEPSSQANLVEHSSAPKTFSSQKTSSHAHSASSAGRLALPPPPDSELPPFQVPFASTSSLPPTAHPASPPWSTVPTPRFGFPRSIWSVLPEDQAHSQHQPPQRNFLAPIFLWYADSTGPLDGGLLASSDDGQGRPGSGNAVGELGLLDLASRVSRLKTDDEDG